MTYRKKLIEVALPLEAINVASAREKSIRHGHPSTLHLWWARRPLAAARAVIFASLVDDPDSADAPPAFVEACRQLPRGKNTAEHDSPRMRLFDFIELLVQWESTTDEKVLNTARQLILLATDGNPPPLLDPFAGGGSIPLEAQRLGLEAHASDLNPVAVMINKAQIEIPPRFANCPPVNPRDRAKVAGSEGWQGAAGLAADVRYYGEWMRAEAWKRIGHLYPQHNGETVIAWLWARTVKCPNPACGAQMPLIGSYWLSKKTNRERWLHPIIDKSQLTVHFRVEEFFPVDKAFPVDTGTAQTTAKATKVKATFQCCVCKNGLAKGEYINEEANNGRMGIMPLAIVAETANGRNYSEFIQDHVDVALTHASEFLENHQIGIPTEPARGTFASNAQGRIYGFKTFSDYFTSRQLIALSTFSDLVTEVSQKIYRDAVFSDLTDLPEALSAGGDGATAYAEAICVYLAFAVDRSADFWSNLAVWANQPKNEIVTHVFGRQAIPMVWDFAEANPFSSSGGNWTGNLEYVAKALTYLGVTKQTGVAIQQDARVISYNNKYLISTDPPYYGNIAYADLSDYFYVWIRRCLRTFYTQIFSTMLTPKSSELVATPFICDGDRNAARLHFENGLEKTFVAISKSVIPKYPFTVYYAYKQAEQESDEDDSEISSTGWDTMLSALIRSGFTINGTWPIRTERPTGLKGATNMLASSIVLVCRLRPADAPVIARRQFVDALRRELPAALKEMQSGNIAPVDLAQASIGPGMAVYSRYRQVLEADGAPLTVRAALGLINQELDSYLAEQDGDIDSDTRFAVAWFEQFGFGEGEFGLADVLARAKNTSVAGVVEAGLVQAARGKVRLVHWHEYDPGAWRPHTDKRPTAWEATHHLIERLNVHGESGAAQLLVSMSPDMASAARHLAYRLYSICERKNWADHARDYNALVISWPAIGEEGVRMKAAAVNGPATQGSLFGE